MEWQTTRREVADSAEVNWGQIWNLAPFAKQSCQSQIGGPLSETRETDSRQHVEGHRPHFIVLYCTKYSQTIVSTKHYMQLVKYVYTATEQ